MRPETDAVFVDREGKQWKSVDWHNMKQRLFAKDLEAQKINLALTGGLGHNDLRPLLEVICLSQNLLSFARFNSSSLCQLVDTMYLPSFLVPECVQEVTRWGEIISKYRKSHVVLHERFRVAILPATFLALSLYPSFPLLFLLMSPSEPAQIRRVPLVYPRPISVKRISTPWTTQPSPIG